MARTRKRGTKGKALTLKKRPTRKQKKAVRNATKQKKKKLTDSAHKALKGLTGKMPKGLLKHIPHVKLPKLKLGAISKKWRDGITHNIHNTTNFLQGWAKALQWPHLVDMSWKCPEKGKSWSGKEIHAPKLNMPHFRRKHSVKKPKDAAKAASDTDNIPQVGGRRRKTKRRRRVRHRRRRRRTRRRQRMRRH